MDSRKVQRYVTAEGFARNEGNVGAYVSTPFFIIYRSIIPKQEECSNLFVPVCLRAFHIAFDSIQMELIFKVL